MYVVALMADANFQYFIIILLVITHSVSNNRTISDMKLVRKINT
jgi:hypothetical protein